MPARARTGCCLALVAASTLIALRAHEAPADPAARGLAFFVHASRDAITGASYPIDVEAYGFARVTSPLPLDGAQVEVGWDPESLGKVSVAPPTVVARSDARGRAHLELPVPPGEGRALKLLVGLRHGDHTRTETLEITRHDEQRVELHVSETRVVPGGAISAWARVARTADGLPIAGQPVDVALMEGSFARWTTRVTTDPAGMGVVRVPIPRVEDPTWSWNLRATAVRDGARATADLGLTTREETPSTPTLDVSWERATAVAGETVPFVVHVRDASGHALAGLPVRTWVGPQGTTPPTDVEAWTRVSTAATTDASGMVRGSGKAPTLVPRGATKELSVVVRAVVEGRALEHHAQVQVGAPAATAEILPEAGALVPGVEERVLVRVRDGRLDGIAGDFVVEGDGLRQTVHTNAAGEAELTWRVPETIGANREVGPCAGGVAAAVRVRSADGKRGPLEACVSVDREARGLVRTAHPFARVGERVHVDIVTPRGAGAPTGPWSVLVTSPSGAVAASAWLDAPTGGDVTLGPGDPGVWQITVAAPGTRGVGGGKAQVLGRELVVAPAVLPALTSKITGGRLVPGGQAEVEAELTDGAGHPLMGSVAAVLIDAEGGGTLQGLMRLDTRFRVCGAAAVAEEDCARFLGGDLALEAQARASLSGKGTVVAPLLDPSSTAEEELRKAFSDVLHSLEGAVLQSTERPDGLGDVRRRGPRGWEWNPELMTLVTSSMSEPPLTPGGEPIALGDLMAIDPQVTFDTAARRVTRLKLFRVLAAVRSFKREHALDPGEPVWKNPNALLRRLVRDGVLEESALLDPWGGTVQFVASTGAEYPFITAVHGFSLQAPGPDGRLGTGDDVRDPFERVVRSGTPYARAMDEDRLVDARHEMEVSEATVEGWQSLLTTLTGVTLGNTETIGHGAGSGSGQGMGSGHGLLGGGHVNKGATMAIATGAAYWSPPQRTDVQGRVRFQVPLDVYATTYRLGLVASPDRTTPASTTLDIVAKVPLSVSVDTGASMIAGDTVDARVVVRNRSAGAVRATLAAAAGGAAVLVKGLPGYLDVPAMGVASTSVRITSKREGQGTLTITTRAPGVAADEVTHVWEVRAPGVEIARADARFVTVEADLDVAAGPGEALRGRAQLVLERGVEEPLRAALRALNPDRLTTPAALADAVESASRIGRWATAAAGPGSPLAVEAEGVMKRARGRFEQTITGNAERFALESARVSAFAPAEEGNVSPSEKASPVVTAAKKRKKGADDDKEAGPCPDVDAEVGRATSLLEAEPPRGSGDLLACWDQTVTNAVKVIGERDDVAQIARAVLALIDRPHRALVAETLLDRLRREVQLTATGDVVLPPGSRSREGRVLVRAALLRGARQDAPRLDRLHGWLAVERDAEGGYGSALATRAAVAALLGAAVTTSGTARVRVDTGSGEQTFELGPSARMVVPLAAAATHARVRVEGGPVLARFERPLLRLFRHPPPASNSPLKLTVGWPASARAGDVDTLHVVIGSSLRTTVGAEIRVPLPPGAMLAVPLDGVRQVQGVLIVRRDVEGGGDVVVEVPLRFGLAGTVTLPEATASVRGAEHERAVAAAQPFWVR